MANPGAYWVVSSILGENLPGGGGSHQVLLRNILGGKPPPCAGSSRKSGPPPHRLRVDLTMVIFIGAAGQVVPGDHAPARDRLYCRRRAGRICITTRTGRESTNSGDLWVTNAAWKRPGRPAPRRETARLASASPTAAGRCNQIRSGINGRSSEIRNVLGQMQTAPADGGARDGGDRGWRPRLLRSGNAPSPQSCPTDSPAATGTSRRPRSTLPRSCRAASSTNWWMKAIMSPPINQLWTWYQQFCNSIEIFGFFKSVGNENRSRRSVDAATTSSRWCRLAC